LSKGSDGATIAHIVAAGAREQPDLDVLTFEHEGRFETRSYAQLWRNGQSLARLFMDLGMVAGDRVALMMQNHPEFVEAMVACAISNLVFVPIDPRTRGDRLAFMLNDCGCRGVLVGDYASEEVRAVRSRTPALEWSRTIGPDFAIGEGSQPELEIAARENDVMQILYTSGTTGDPKGVIVRHQRFGAVGTVAPSLYGYRQEDRPYTGLSLTHANAQFVTLAPSLKMGMRAVFSRRFTRSRFWDVIRACSCTTVSLLGGIATALYGAPERPDDRDNPIRLVTSAGMPPAIWEAFERRFGVAIGEYYGALEGGQTIRQVGTGPYGSCGRVAASLVAKVVDEHDVEVARGEPGEIIFRPADGSPAVVEYYNNPEAAALKTAGGWLRSGDIVRMDADGWVYFEYRKGGGLRKNGDFIAADAVEKVLAEHPAVDDVFVYGIPAASGAPGEKDIVAAIVCNGAAKIPDDLFSWCRERLEGNAIPDFMQIVDQIPKTASEKPQERFLAAQLASHPESVIKRNA